MVVAEAEPVQHLSSAVPVPSQVHNSYPLEWAREVDARRFCGGWWWWFLADTVPVRVSAP